MIASKRQQMIQCVIDRCKMALHVAECAKNQSETESVIQQMVKTTSEAHAAASAYNKALIDEAEEAKTN